MPQRLARRVAAREGTGRRVEDRGHDTLVPRSRSSREPEHARGHLFGVTLADCVTERLAGHAGCARRVDQRQSVLTFSDLEDGHGQRHGAHDGRDL
jgi:hypothetical protein